MFRKNYSQALATMDIKEISAQLNESNVNRDAGGFRAFEILLDRKDKLSTETLIKILTHPRWNPNYRVVDGWSPLERAILHHREGVAQKILEHPNFKAEDVERPIQIAKGHTTKRFQNLLQRKLQNQR